MKIKFLKDYRYPGGGYNNKGDVRTFEDAEFAKWAIDNGFAEEVKESGWWKPKPNEKYFYVSGFCEVLRDTWNDLEVDRDRFFVGNVFKTEGAAGRRQDYLKAIATVRQDEGVLTPGELTRFCNSYAEIYYVCSRWGKLDCWLYSLDGRNPIAGAIAFSTREHAQASRDKHLDEWKIIANYDWSKE